MRTLLLLVCLGLLLGTGGCGSSEAPGRIIVLGLDGLDPDVIDLLMAEGKLPSFARLRQGGAYGRLVSSKPLLSPIIWTTLATGKPPLDHGIGHFVAVNEKTGAQLPVTSHMRRTKAIWNVLSDAGRTVDVVGWWATWPAETIRGTVVSDHTCYHFLFTNGVAGDASSVGVISPPDAADALRPLIRRPGDLTFDDVARFVTVSPDEFSRPFDFDDDLSHFKWALATAQTYSAIGLQLWTQRPDLLLVYIEGVDSSSHLFGHLFRAPGLSGELAEQQRRYGMAVEEMYLYADRMVGQYLEALDADTTLIVLSDHGFQLGVLPDDPSKTRDMRRVSERYHRIEGILYMYGNRVRPHRRIDQPVLLDIAPTILALSGVPPARDMPGRVLSEAVDLPDAFVDRTVASYDGGRRAAAGQEASGASSVDPKILEHLRALGYLDAQSPQGDRNLAALHFEAGRYAEAVEAYAALVSGSPGDANLRASLAGALGALGRLDESLAELDKAIEIDPINSEAYHNRGVLHEKRGDPDTAAREYATALRYNPQYVPARQALARLQGGAVEADSLSAAEQLASAMAERARDAALRGDYDSALQQLDEAERVAPRFARIQQYRSNVAFLRGDYDGAAAALRRALEIEPDNALFRTNLERVERQSMATRPPDPAP
jgi:tetratricopeptide (TPR) repeat protein